METPREYAVSRAAKQPLLDFVLKGLEESGCRLIHVPDAGIAPWRITFETSEGERMGILLYAFHANSRVTKNRPADEHRFQVKYGSKDGRLHELWQDPYGLYVTLFCGIDPKRRIFVAADPVLHSPTRFFISIEFKRKRAVELARRGWAAWERNRKPDGDEPIEVLVGGRAGDFLRYVRFEREAFGEAQGHRHLIAEKDGFFELGKVRPDLPVEGVNPSPHRLHDLAVEFAHGEVEVLNLIASARRLKMAVRGWVAEEHLVRQLRKLPGVTDCVRNDMEGAADVTLRFENVPLTVECKNVLRLPRKGFPHLDFQRTRAAKGDPCSRYYSVGDFDVVAACLNAIDQRWSFRFIASTSLDAHAKCPGKLSSNVRVDDRWAESAVEVFRKAIRAKVKGGRR